MLEVQMVAASPAAWASLVLVEGLVPLMAAGRYTRPEVFVYATHRAPAWFLLWEYKPGHKGWSVVIDRF